jgi:hypothetical protein
VLKPHERMQAAADDATSHAKALQPPASLAHLFSDGEGTSLRRGPTPQQPSFAQHLSNEGRLAPDDRASPSGGARSPLDALVFDLGGRPISRASSYATSRSGGHTSTETGHSVHEHEVDAPPLPTTGVAPEVALPSPDDDDDPSKRDSLASRTDTTSVRDMEVEIRKIESESDLRGTEGVAEEPVASKWSATTGSAKSVVPGALMIDEDEDQAAAEVLVDKLPPRGDDITPRTAKRWSIVEMEESFRRMQSSASLSCLGEVLGG